MCLLGSKQASKDTSKMYLNFREYVQTDRTEVPALYLAAQHAEPSVLLFLHFSQTLHWSLQEKLSLLHFLQDNGGLCTLEVLIRFLCYSALLNYCIVCHHS